MNLQRIIGQLLKTFICQNRHLFHLRSFEAPGGVEVVTVQWPCKNTGGIPQGIPTRDSVVQLEKPKMKIREPPVGLRTKTHRYIFIYII